MLRTCTACKIEKVLGDFALRSDLPGKFRSHCRQCVNDQNLARYHKRPLTKSAHTSAGRRHLLKRYGLTPEGYSKMLAEQGGACATCGGKDTDRHLAVDHDHISGRVRALLCWTCNTGIGKLRDSPALLRLAASYIERFSNA